MSRLPLLFFPSPASVPKKNLSGRGRSFSKPSPERQRELHDVKFRRIAESFQSLQPSAQGLEPEQVLVLETAGDMVEGLAKAAGRIPGMEWLAELDAEDLAADDDFCDQKESDKALPHRLYAVMTNQQAMNSLVGLWDAWLQDPAKRARPNFGPFKNLFINLSDLRRWGAEDRVAATGVVEYLQERLVDSADEIRFEVELWCRSSQAAREQAYVSLAELVSAAGGVCLKQAAVPAIAYHGVLVKMPADAVRRTVGEVLAGNFGPLVRCEEVMFFRPSAQTGFALEEVEAGAEDGELDSSDSAETSRPPSIASPIAALLDGAPLENHADLRGRIVVNDPDELSSHYQHPHQRHGTAMASLVALGDKNESSPPLQTPLYVRPILAPTLGPGGEAYEMVPDDELFVDVVHRAVREIFAGESPAAPTVKVVNLSVANRFQPFDRELSPLARLLDWLSWEFKVLFLVSVGNHTDDVVIEATNGTWRQLTDDQLREQTLRALHADQLTRRPFAPAESVNAVTVGAIHADASQPLANDRRVELLPGARLPSPIGSVASGYRGSVKPEVYFPGGRQWYHQPLGGSLEEPAKFSLPSVDGVQPPGQRVAAPGPSAMELNRTVHSRGTSNATALATRQAAQLYERLLELESEPGGDQLASADTAVILKCLLVHGASWGAAVELIDQAFADVIKSEHDSAQRAAQLLARLRNRFLGFGEVDPDFARFCSDQRVTAVGWESLGDGEGHRFRLPLPEALSGRGVVRRLTTTLAWMTPVNPQHRNYRMAQLWFDLDGKSVGVGKKDVDMKAAQRGTVEHLVLEGKKVVTYGEAESLDIVVSCRADAGKLETPAPYALAVTIEVAEPLGVSLFEQVSPRIRPRVPIEPGS